MSKKNSMRRLLRFSLRSLIAAMLLAALGFAWLHYEMERAEDRRLTVERLREFPGYVMYDIDPDETMATDQSSTAAEKLRSWLTSQFGVDFTHHVDLICVGGGNQFTDADLVATCRLHHLTSLRLGSTTVTDTGMKHVTQLEKLERLAIASPHLTDRSMKYIARLSNLQQLRLHDARITDRGLAQLAALTKLEHVDLSGTQVTATGAADLRARLPGCEIISD